MKHAQILAFAVGASACASATREADLTHSTRLVRTPSAIAVLARDTDTPELAPEISFGSTRGRSALYLKFPADFATHGAPLKAFIALTPRADSPPDVTPVVVEAWRVNRAWQATKLRTWSDKPSLAPPYARTLSSSSPAHELRIDVTELVRFAVQHPTQDFGIALLGGGGSGPGLCFDTGMSQGQAPRLELYVR